MIPSDCEAAEFILNNYIGVSRRSMTKLLNKSLNTAYTDCEVQYFYQRYNLKSGLSGKYESGHASWNKGKHLEDLNMSPDKMERIKNSWFKKGHPCLSQRPIGSIRFTNGMYWIKIENPRTWKRLHTYLWEKEYGKIPKGKVLIFMDGNKKNCCIENLMLIDRNENLYLNRKEWRFNNQPELQKSAIGVVRLDSKIRGIK